jgi:steroid delta-isomerase-like uncharacterized protein
MAKRDRGFTVLGPVLRALRVARGWTQRDAADRAGVSDRLVRRAERGGPIELTSIALLAQLYSTPDGRLTPKDILAEALDEAPESSSEAKHEALARRWWDEVVNQGRLEVIDELTMPDCVLHTDDAELRGRAALRQRTEAIRAAFSDIHVDVEQVNVRGEWVASRWRVSQLHTGIWKGVPATGKPIVLHGSTWMRIENGLFAEAWNYWQQPLTDVLRAAQPKKGARRKRP